MIIIFNYANPQTHTEIKTLNVVFFKLNSKSLCRFTGNVVLPLRKYIYIKCESCCGVVYYSANRRCKVVAVLLRGTSQLSILALSRFYIKSMYSTSLCFDKKHSKYVSTAICTIWITLFLFIGKQLLLRASTDYCRDTRNMLATA